MDSVRFETAVSARRKADSAASAACISSSPAVLKAKQGMLARLDGAEQSELLRFMAKAIAVRNEQSRVPHIRG